MFKISKQLFEITFIVRGYHVYKNIFDVEINSVLHCSPKPSS